MKKSDIPDESNCVALNNASSKINYEKIEVCFLYKLKLHIFLIQCKSFILKYNNKIIMQCFLYLFFSVTIGL